MAKKQEEKRFETMGQVLDEFGIKRTAFGEAVGWKLSTIPMKLNRKRSWTVPEYERALVVAKKYNLPVDRSDLVRFSVKLAEA